MHWNNTFRNAPSQPGVVKRMREIRDELSLKIMHMTLEEEKAMYEEGRKRWEKWRDEHSTIENNNA